MEEDMEVFNFQEDGCYGIYCIIRIDIFNGGMLECG